MTICSKMYEALDKRLDEKKNLDEIGSELCDAVDDPRGKAIRLIKQHKGEEYLTKNADWLGYQTHTPTVEMLTKKSELLDCLESEESKTDNFAPDEIVHESQEQLVAATSESEKREPVVNPSWDELPCRYTPPESLTESQRECPVCGRGVYNTDTDTWEERK